MEERANAFRKLFGLKRETAEATLTPTEKIGRNAVKTFSGVRVLFGVVFLFDGILKWIIFQQGTMQALISGYGSTFGYSYLAPNWLAFGVLVGVGETLGGVALILGLFQRPAALWSALIMFLVWGYTGFGGLYSPAMGITTTNYTDPGGDLMLALVFVALVFSPYAYSLASRFKLRERWPGNSLGHKVLRFLVT